MTSSQDVSTVTVKSGVVEEVYGQEAAKLKVHTWDL